ncbi:MAG: acetyltransferase [Bacteroidota bacterium]
MEDIVIVGAGGFGREVKMLIDQINHVNPTWNFLGYYDDNLNAKIDSDLLLGSTEQLLGVSEKLHVVVALGNPLTKKLVVSKLEANNAIQFATLVHPSVWLDNSVTIDVGTIICSGNIITVDINIGRHVILNLGCTVGHDSRIGDFSSFMPSVNISGEVEIEECVYAGTGAKIINQLTIGYNTVLGAGAVVTKSIPSGSTAVGMPAKVIKRSNDTAD